MHRGSTPAQAANALRAGGLVILPTETVYGLAADAGRPAAVARLFEAKGRPRFNPLIAHVQDLAAARRLAALDETALALAEAFWPGPLTLVAPYLCYLRQDTVFAPGQPLSRDVVCGLLGRACGVIEHHGSMGVPGRLKGWMSRHGHLLKFNDHGRAVCPESGFEYECRDGAVRCLSLDEEAPLPAELSSGAKSYDDFTPQALNS